MILSYDTLINVIEEIELFIEKIENMHKPKEITKEVVKVPKIVEIIV